MSSSPLEYLQHMLDEVDYLVERSRGLSREQFIEDPTLQRAFVRSLEILGEATKKLPGDFKRAHPDVEWRAMAGMRDHLIHGYFGVDYEIVWDVVSGKIPGLRRTLRDLVAEQLRRSGASEGGVDESGKSS